MSILWAISSASPDFISMPFSAPFPVPTIMATGVASPRAQGHEITSTAIPIDRANSKELPTISQVAVLIMAISITKGTNTPEILSAILAIGALVSLASATRFAILFMVVSSPTVTALILICPDLFIVPAVARSPTVL